MLFVYDSIGIFRYVVEKEKAKYKKHKKFKKPKLTF
jgi:hypothetical protein